MSNILFLVSSDKHTGPGAVAVQHAQLISEGNHNVFFCCQPGGSLQDKAVQLDLWLDSGLYLPSRGARILLVPLDVMTVRRLVRQHKIDTVWVYRSNDHLTAWAAVGGKIPVVRFLHKSAQPAELTVGDLVMTTALPPLPPSTTWMLRKAEHILVPEPAMAGIVLSALGKQAPARSGHSWEYGEECLTLDPATTGVEFVAGGIDTYHYTPDRGGNRIRSELGFDDQNVVVGMVARFKPDRGHGLFLDAFAKASQQEPMLRALLIGDGLDKTKADFRKQAEELGIGNRVALFNPGARFEEALAAIDIGFIFHPGSAGTGRAALELMSMARPMVLFGRGVLAHFAQPPGTAIRLQDMQGYDLPGFMEMEIDERIAASLVYLAENPEQRMTMGMAARALIEERFGRSVVQKQLLALCERLS